MRPATRDIAARAFAAAALLIAAVVLGLASRQLLLPAAASVVVFGAAAVGPRWSASALVEIAASVVVLGLGMFIGLEVAGQSPALAPPWLAGGWAAIAIGALELVLANTRPRVQFALLAALVAMLFGGQLHLGVAYPALIVAFVATSAAAMRASDSGRGPLFSVSARTAAVTAALVALTAGSALALAIVLLPLWKISTGLVTPTVDAQSGFSDRLWLGSLDGMLQSDEKVMRIAGPRVDYLRGAVYDLYIARRWSTTHAALRAFQPEKQGASATTSTDVITFVGGDRDRAFLPIDAARVRIDASPASVDRFGVVHTPIGNLTSAAFDASSDAAKRIDVAPPGNAELQVPPTLDVLLHRMARDFTAGATTPRQKVDAIAARLSHDFTYSLTYDHKRSDPLEDFLIGDRRGHCEYFASALALLARASGVPARVVGGYRVNEHSPFGDYFIVRQRDAHAWVEVYVDGAWRTADATPTGDGSMRSTGWFSAAADRMALAWPSVRAELRLLQAWHGAIPLALVAAAWAIRRELRRRRALPARTAALPDVAAPHRDVARFFAALDSLGVARARAEALEAFAARLEASKQGPAASLVTRYAALRYGGVGDEAALLADIAAWSSEATS